MYCTDVLITGFMNMFIPGWSIYVEYFVVVLFLKWKPVCLQLDQNVSTVVNKIRDLYKMKPVFDPVWFPAPTFAWVALGIFEIYRGYGKKDIQLWTTYLKPHLRYIATVNKFCSQLFLSNFIKTELSFKI